MIDNYSDGTKQNSANGSNSIACDMDEPTDHTLTM